VLRALELAWPEWLNAQQVHEICEILRPEWRKNGAGVWRTSRALGRLQSYRIADRIGEPVRLKGRVKSGTWKTGWLRGRGYRYRLAIRTEDLL